MYIYKYREREEPAHHVDKHTDTGWSQSVVFLLPRYTVDIAVRTQCNR